MANFKKGTKKAVKDFFSSSLTKDAKKNGTNLCHHNEFCTNSSDHAITVQFKLRSNRKVNYRPSEFLDDILSHLELSNSTPIHNLKLSGLITHLIDSDVLDEKPTLTIKGCGREVEVKPDEYLIKLSKSNKKDIKF